MKYKITEKTIINNNGTEEYEYYIKKRVLGIWYLTNDYGLGLRFWGKFMSFLISFILFLIICFPISLIVGVWVLFFIIPTVLFCGDIIGNNLFSDSYSSLSSAKEDLKNILKRKNFSNKSRDVLEIYKNGNNFIMEQKN